MPPPDEHAPLLAETAVRPGAGTARLAACRSALAIILRSAAITELNLKSPGFKTRPLTSALSYPACLLFLPVSLSAFSLKFIVRLISDTSLLFLHFNPDCHPVDFVFLEI